MQMLIKSAVLALSCLTLAQAVAAPQYCLGKVSNIWLDGDGHVYVYPEYRDAYTRICNVNAETGGVSVMNCLAWFSILKSAVQRKTLVMVHYTEAPPCRELPTYGASLVPGYVMQIE